VAVRKSRPLGAAIAAGMGKSYRVRQRPSGPDRMHVLHLSTGDRVALETIHASVQPQVLALNLARLVLAPALPGIPQSI
jgi:hypothetical protein